MKVEILKDGLIVVPETDFEIQYLRSFYHPHRLEAFLKHGVSISTVLGLKVKFPPDINNSIDEEMIKEDKL